MSLLIDALRKAEADRQRAASAADGAPSEDNAALALEPLKPATAKLPPPRPARMEPAPGQHPPRSAPASARPAVAPPSGTAAALPTLPHGQPQRLALSPVSWALGIGLCLALAGGFHVWRETQPRGFLAEPQVASSAAPLPAPTAPLAAARPDPAPTITAAPPAQPPRQKRARAQVVAASPDLDSGPVVRRGAAKLANPAANNIEAGYAAYERGDLDAAREHYLAALRGDPRAADAIDGLGAIALKADRTDEAERWFRQALANNPADPVAQAGLASLGRESDARATETRLSDAIAHAPNIAATHFSLGALQARSSRWAEAQQSFFRAYSLEPDNPDYRFNLAIALDHLNQRMLAAQFYGLALTAADQRPAHFDREATSRRLAALNSAPSLAAP